MSTYMLGSLSNRDYDDYVKRRMSRLDHRADSFRNVLSSRDEAAAILCEDPYCRQYRTRPPASRKPPQRRSSAGSSSNGTRRPFATHASAYHYHDDDDDIEDRQHYRQQWRAPPQRRQQQQPPPPRRRSLSTSTLDRRERPTTRQHDTHYYDDQETEEDDWHRYYSQQQQQHQHRPRRPASLGAENYYYYDNENTSIHSNTDYSDSNNNDNDDDEDDDESMNEMEKLAQENARRNILVLADDPAVSIDPLPVLLQPQQQQQQQNVQLPQQLPQSLDLAHQHALPVQPVIATTAATAGSAATVEVESSLQQQQQPEQRTQQPPQPQVSSITTTPSMSTTSSSSTPPKKKKRWPFSIFARRDPSSPVGPTTPSPLNTASPIGRVHAVKSNGPPGDVLDAHQQEELVRQLYNKSMSNNTVTSVQDGLNLSGATTDRNNSNNNQPQQQQRTQDSDNMMMVASLDRIWVFRASNSNANTTANVWITFDYNNQQLLTKYKKKLDKSRVPYDEGVEFFDSHIRQGKLPVLVLPSRRQAYYPTNLSGDEIISIEVACIPNSPDLQFVYRQHQHQQQQRQ